MGYVANQAQSDSSTTGIVLLMTLLPGVFALIAALVIWRYPLDKTQVEQLQFELAQRRQLEARE